MSNINYHQVLGHICWLCHNCQDRVYPDKNNKPQSKYYLADFSEVYCSARCSLVCHESRNIK